MGSLFSGRGRNFLIAPSIGMKSLAEPGSRILRDGVTLWVVCGPWSTLDRERRISLGIWSELLQDEVTLLGSCCVQLDRE